jgi:hypothetical protein
MHPQAQRAYSLLPAAAASAALPAAPCAMCGTLSAGPHCGHCGAPLTPPPQVGDVGEPLAGRRGSPRVSRDEQANWLPAGGAPGEMTVRLLDVGFTGLSVASMLPVADLAIARVRTGGLDTVVQVLRSRRHFGGWTVHTRLLTLRVLQRAGAFVSARA